MTRVQYNQLILILLFFEILIFHLVIWNGNYPSLQYSILDTALCSNNHSRLNIPGCIRARVASSVLARGASSAIVYANSDSLLATRSSVYSKSIPCSSGLPGLCDKSALIMIKARLILLDHTSVFSCVFVLAWKQHISLN